MNRRYLGGPRAFATEPTPRCTAPRCTCRSRRSCRSGSQQCGRGARPGRLLRRFFSPASPALLGGKIHAHTVFFFFNLKADPLLVMITCIFPKEKKNVFSGTVSNVKEASDFLARRGLLAAGWAGVPTPWCCSGFSPLNALRPCPWRRPHAGRTGARRLKVDALSFSEGALRNPRFSTLLEKNRILRLHFRRQNSNFCTVVT